MLVCDIQRMNEKRQSVGSLVWTEQLHKSLRAVAGGPHGLSYPGGQVFRLLSYRKLTPIYVAAILSDNHRSEMVECSSHVVNHIASYQRQLDRGFSQRLCPKNELVAFTLANNLA